MSNLLKCQLLNTYIKNKELYILCLLMTAYQGEI